MDGTKATMVVNREYGEYVSRLSRHENILNERHGRTPIREAIL